MTKILIVDDETGVCHSFGKILGRKGYTVITATNGIEAIEQARSEAPDLIIMDVSMPKMDGLDTLQKLKSTTPDITVIMMTAYSTSEKAITAMKYGAYDYLTKPFENATLTSLVEKALIDKQMSSPVTFDMSSAEHAGDRIIGKGSVMLDIFKKVGQIASSDVTVLLTGATGTGKELVARAIYHHSERIHKPFLPVNCSAIPEPLLESELFGHEKGAFTGADSKRVGKFEQCDTGTMFLDEISDMPLSIQSKWLRVLQDGCFQRLGGKEFISSDVRIIAATNRDLQELVKQKRFREDLYWRLNVVSIDIPPLRERKEDIEALVKYFIQKYSREFSKGVKGISPDLLGKFQDYPWPGNVRELQGVIQRGMVLCQKDHLSFDDCGSFLGTPVPVEGREDIEKLLSEAAELILRRKGTSIYKDGISEFERVLIRKALEMTDYNQVMTSKLLGISRNTLRSKMGKD